MITYTGIHITREFGAPSIRDIAVQLMRIPRFVGGTPLFWPVGMHSLLVADILCEIPACHQFEQEKWCDRYALEVYGLLHDAEEVVCNDIPQPIKTGEQRFANRVIRERIYAFLGVPEPGEAIERLVKQADMKAVCAEGSCECGPRGFIETEINYVIDPKAGKLLQGYLSNYDPRDAIHADGRWPLHFERRLRLALRDMRHLRV